MIKKEEEKSPVNFAKALQNLSDMLIDKRKLYELNINIFKALDEDDIGTVSIVFLEQFTRDFLKGEQV